MACSSISPFIAGCGEILRSGTKATYMIAFSDLKLITGTASVYTIAGGVVSTISLQADKKFSKVDLTSKSEGITETHTVADNGIITSTAGFTGSITGFSKESGAFVKSLLGQPVVVLNELASGSWVAVGLDGGFYLKESAGTHNATDSNRALTFGGDIFDVVPEVDKTLIPTLI